MEVSTIGATLRIMSGIPFDASYSNTRLFPNATAQLAYFNSMTVVYWTTDFNQVRMQNRGYVDIPVDFDAANTANYLYFSNTNDPRTYYCFIIDVEILANGSTRVYFIRDVMQTWMFDYSFQSCLIEREHVQSSSTRNIIPESIMTGNEYETVATQNITPQSNLWFVIVVKNRFDDDYNSGSPSSQITTAIGNTPDSLNYYIIPFTSIDTDLTLSVMPAGSASMSNVTFGAWSILTLLNSFLASGNNASEGVNNISNMYVTEFMPLSLSTQLIQTTIQASYAGNSAVAVNVLVPRTNASLNQTVTQTSNLYVNNLITGIDAEKINYYPFTKIEIYDSRGNMMSYKPEGLPANNVLSLQFSGSLGPNQSMFAGLVGYNGETSIQMVKTRALVNNSPQDVPILSEYLAAFLQGNKNMLENQKQFLEDDLEYNQQVNRVGRVANWTSTASSALLATGALLLAPKTGGASIAAKTSLASAGIGLSIGNAGIRDVQNAMQYDNLERIFDQNIANIYALQEDLENKPPSANVPAANLNLIMGNNLMNYTIAIKRVRPAYVQVATDYFNMFGFKTNRLAVPVLRTRSNWNYIKLATVNITANFYNDDIQLIKEIYKGGITFWHTNAVGNYSQANTLFTD